MNRIRLSTTVLALGALGVAAWYYTGATAPMARPTTDKPADKPSVQEPTMPEQVNEFAAANLPRTEADWKKVLSPEQFRVLRQKGTERAFTGKYWDTKKDGTYRCAGCGQELFSSKHKFDSGTGWPSFWQPIEESSVAKHDDHGFFMRRTEVVCSRCEGHLGHVFDDGPDPTGQRYCINSAALRMDDDSSS